MSLLQYPSTAIIAPSLLLSLLPACFVHRCSGFKLAASDFESLAAKSQGVLWRAVADEPRILSEKTLFLTVDIDDMFIGTDVRLVQLFAKPEACTVEAEGACKVEWFLRDPSPGRSKKSSVSREITTLYGELQALRCRYE